MDYEKLYKIIFNGVTDAIDCMEAEGYARAKEILIKAQQDAEEYYICAEEDDAECPCDGGSPVPIYILPHDAHFRRN